MTEPLQGCWNERLLRGRGSVPKFPVPAAARACPSRSCHLPPAAAPPSPARRDNGAPASFGGLSGNRIPAGLRAAVPSVFPPCPLCVPSRQSSLSLLSPLCPLPVCSVPSVSSPSSPLCSLLPDCSVPSPSLLCQVSVPSLSPPASPLYPLSVPSLSSFCPLPLSPYYPLSIPSLSSPARPLCPLSVSFVPSLSPPCVPFLSPPRVPCPALRALLSSRLCAPSQAGRTPRILGCRSPVPSPAEDPKGPGGLGERGRAPAVCSGAAPVMSEGREWAGNPPGWANPRSEGLGAADRWAGTGEGAAPAGAGGGMSSRSGPGAPGSILSSSPGCSGSAPCILL